VQPPLSPPPVTYAPPPVNVADEPAAPTLAPVPEPLEPAPPAPRPEPFVTLPVPEPPTAPAPAAFAPPAAVPVHRVGVRLTTGELIEVAAHEDEAGARAEATALMRYLRDGRGDWPFLAGRFVRPETIVSIDVDSA
jgi:hypothetical protein